MFHIQYSFSDCGYACISALLSHYKSPSPVHAIKAFVGSTERGLTIAQIQAACERVGARSTAIAFDRSRPSAYPCPGVVLLKRGHYVALTKRRGNKFKVFDPAIGWQTLDYKHFELDAVALGIEVKGVATRVLPPESSASPFWSIARRQAFTGLGAQVLLLALLAQAMSLAIPLLTQQSVDAVVPGSALSGVSMIAVAFVLISVIGQLSSVVVSIGNRMISKRLGLALAGDIFDRLAKKNIDWFQARPMGYSFTQYQALTSLQQFYGEIINRLLSVLLMGTVGMLAMFYISPWLIIPGLVSMVLSSLLDWAYRAPLQSNGAKTIQVQTQQRAFFYDVMSQLPMLMRLGSLWRGRARLRRRVRSYADVQLAGARLNATKTSLGSLLSTFEQLVFVCLAGYFVRTENYSLGVFVAAGLYKDQFANALSSLFQLWQQHALLQPQREQLAELMAEKPLAKTNPGEVIAGNLDIECISFRYGTLDNDVLQNVSLHVSTGQCLVLKGPSGAGKTTLIKLICGAATPTRGRVLIDGRPVVSGIRGLGEVLQTDRLITDSIRENVLLFRSASDDEIYAALNAVGLENFVRSLPMQLNTGIGEGMTGLSGGQRQRIVLARALIGAPKLLVFDEATSSLDVEGEAELLMKLRERGVTLILCSHRPEVWTFADRVFDVRDGTVNEVVRK
ncbi:MAG: peptidase domain-containing ABC transporter [Burkholderiales bacterium]